MKTFSPPATTACIARRYFKLDEKTIFKAQVCNGSEKTRVNSIKYFGGSPGNSDFKICSVSFACVNIKFIVQSVLNIFA